MKVVRTRSFDRSAKKLGASASDLAALERAIGDNPGAGDVIPGLRGVRKVRFAMKGRGKSGGGRCIYLVLWKADTAFLLLAYDKTVQADLSDAQRSAILSLLESLIDD